MNDKLKPALIGGVVLGILSAIPFVNWVNLCCCAWAIAGGVLAANLYVKSSPAPVQPADGAMVGALAGVIGGLIYVVIGVPLGYVVGSAASSALAGIIASSNPDQADMIRTQMAAQSGSLVGAFFKGILGAVVITIFSTIGGLIGVAIFEKRKGGAGAPPPPPPPPAGGGFGGPAGGGGYGGQGGPAAGGGYGQGI